MKLASIVLDIATQSLDAPYTYVVPEGMDDAEVGCPVLVPFGHRRAVGFVMAVAEWDASSPDTPMPAWAAGVSPAKLKAIARVLGHPYFDEEGAACAQWMAHRCIAPLSACVRLFTPPGGVPRVVRNSHGGWAVEEPSVGEVDDRWVMLAEGADGFVPRKGAAKQEAILSALSQGELRVAELKIDLGNVDASLKSLEEKGVVRIERRRRMRGVPGRSSTPPRGCGSSSSTEYASSAPRPDSAHSSAPERSGKPHRSCDEGSSVESSVYTYAVVPVKPELTEGQTAALEAIEAARARRAGEVVLVDGVTGSGKTEVYLRAIESVLAAGETAIVLVPEISLTPQTVARFRGRFGDTVAVMHSRMSAGERYDQWDLIRSGDARVVVGARSALFTPLRNVGLIVIDEEHETTYKQDSAPRYHARDVAVWMAARSGAAVVLGSATPAIETLHACATRDGWRRVVLGQRANGRPLPEVGVVDMAREFSGGHRSMFSRPLISALETELGAGRKAVLLLNQRGFAKFLLCRDCGFVPTCPSCSTSLTFHERGNALVCHHCGHRVPAPPVCPSCGSPYLKKFGAGTQRVEDDLVALIAGFEGFASRAEVIRMDADTTSRKGAHERLLERFAMADSAVLLGTQMIAKGLDFDDVTLVGVINADTTLRLPDYRAAERTFDMIEQVAGRAGRADLPGRVIVQTYDAQSVPIQAAASYDRAAFLRDELPKRRMLGYPPYVRIANVLVWGESVDRVREVACALADVIAARVRDMAGDGWTVLPATPCVLSKLRGSYRWHVVVKCPSGADLPGVLEPVFRSRKAENDVNVAVDVDPSSLL